MELGAVRRDAFLKKITRSSLFNKKRGIKEMVRVYTDVEKTLHLLKLSYQERNLQALRQINVGKLINQLNRSKKRLKRKIGNTFILEKT